MARMLFDDPGQFFMVEGLGRKVVEADGEAAIARVEALVGGESHDRERQLHLLDHTHACPSPCASHRRHTAGPRPLG